MYRDRVRETSTTVGTASFTLAGAVTGYRTFSSAFSTAGAYYVIVNRDNPSEWEIGSFTVSGATLTRTAGNVLSSSAGAGTLVNFSAGTKEIYNAPPASVMSSWAAAADLSSYVLKTGDSMTGLLTSPGFQTNGSSGATGFKIAGGTDLAAIFAPINSVMSYATGSGSGYGATPRLTSLYLSRSGNALYLTVGTAC